MNLHLSMTDTVDPAAFKRRVGDAARAVAAQAERDMRAYIPSTRVANNATVQGRKVIWSDPIAPVLFQGRVMVDPKLGIGGFPVEDGWRSRKGVEKVSSNRMMRFRRGGPRWTDRAVEQHLPAWLKLARRIILDGK